MAAVQVSVRVDEDVKKRAARVFGFYGLDLSTAIRSFITTTANEQRIPYRVDIPTYELVDKRHISNPDTADAFAELDAFERGDIDLPEIDNLSELWDDCADEVANGR
jgi:addiction module RelB/DinJ family antitoxin